LLSQCILNDLLCVIACSLKGTSACISGQLRAAVSGAYIHSCVCGNSCRTQLAEGFDLASAQKQGSGLADFAEAEVLAKMYPFR